MEGDTYIVSIAHHSWFVSRVACHCLVCAIILHTYTHTHTQDRDKNQYACAVLQQQISDLCTTMPTSRQHVH